jgi:cytochrome P450
MPGTSRRPTCSDRSPAGAAGHRPDPWASPGDSVALFYASANRDEAVYEDPFAFRLDRNPNPHLGFGIGEHFCLGAHLARLDLQVFLRHLVRRVEAIELAGSVELLKASFVGGPKRVPVRCRLRPRAA